MVVSTINSPVSNVSSSNKLTLIVRASPVSSLKLAAPAMKNPRCPIEATGSYLNHLIPAQVIQRPILKANDDVIRLEFLSMRINFKFLIMAPGEE